MEYFLVLSGYLIGSIPFGLLFGKCLGVDVRAAGSGNIGATNVNRLLGKKMGALTLLADIGKSLLPMLGAAWLLQGRPGAETWVMVTGGAAFLGHLYPVFLRFRGGKGVATALGVFFYLHPVAVLICIAAFAGIVALSGYVSLGSIVAAALMPVLVWLLDGPEGYVWLASFICLFIWLKHRENIKRLLTNQEDSIKNKVGNEE